MFPCRNDGAPVGLQSHLGRASRSSDSEHLSLVADTALQQPRCALSDGAAEVSVCPRTAACLRSNVELHEVFRVQSGCFGRSAQSEYTSQERALQYTTPLRSSAGIVLQLPRLFSGPGLLRMLVSAPTMSKLSLCLLQGAAVTQAFVLSGPGTGTAGNACEFRETNQCLTLAGPIDSATCIAAGTRVVGSNARSGIAPSARIEPEAEFCVA